MSKIEENEITEENVFVEDEEEQGGSGFFWKMMLVMATSLVG